MAQVAAGVVAGSAAACMSQPFDTFKTIKQRDFSLNKGMAEVIFQKSAFAGLGWRVAIVTIATTTISFIQEKLSGAMKPSQQ